MRGLTRYKNKTHKYFSRICLLLFDIVTLFLSYFMALWIRYDCRINEIPKNHLKACLEFSIIIIPITVYIYYIYHLYRSLWKYVSHTEIFSIVQAVAISFIIHCAAITAVFHRMPFTYYFLGVAFQLFFILGSRGFFRFIWLIQMSAAKVRHAKRVMLVGIGENGRSVIKDIQKFGNIQDKVICIIDDDKSIWGDFITGVEVLGGREKIVEAAKKNHIERIYIAIPSDTIRNKKDLLQKCEQTGAEVLILPELDKLMNGEINVAAFREVKITDLLGRDEIKVNLDELKEYLSGKTVLVTGGGGSIGSELTREIAQKSPKKLIVFDVYENNAYDIQQELKRKYGDELDLEVIIGSVRDRDKVLALFEKFHPDIVYHAAAHKHVPLMEDSPCEAVKNNVLGTYDVAYASLLYNVEKFILISTDKAVNPTNIMGASKRMCEMIIQTFAHYVANDMASDIPAPDMYSKDENISDKLLENVKNAKTEFAAVRFGNVLGSNGSVVPLFTEQIRKGGPVTVTHPDIIRYFMTIPEAVSLVLQAGYYAKGGEIFVLDMGKPVKIDTLARNLITLSGYKPDVDIKIVYTGLRPGEKLYEELLMGEEGLDKTPNDLIFIGKPIALDEEAFFEHVNSIIRESFDNGTDIREVVGSLVKTYKIGG